jgi:hypothetical protein
MAKRKYPPKHHWSPFPTWTGFLDPQPDFEIEGFDTHFTRGSGTTEHRFLSPNVYVDWGWPPELLAEIEKAAWQILDCAELLTAPEEDYTLPAKRGPWERLLEAMKDREFMDKEWYAARILSQTSLLRYHIAEFTESAKAPKVEKTKTSPELIEEALEFYKWSSKKRTPQEIDKKFEKEFTRIARKYDDPFVPTIQQIVQETVICAMMLGGQLTEAHRRFGSEKGNSSDAGTARGIQQTEARKPEWAKWQEEAEKVWKKHRRWGKPAVAEAVHEKFPDVPVETIRPRIKKPSP